MDFDAPEADAADQARVEDVEPGEDQLSHDQVPDDRPSGAAGSFAEADPADLADQQRVVPDEEDLYDR